jgi:hypothetical protein
MLRFQNLHAEAWVEETLQPFCWDRMSFLGVAVVTVVFGFLAIPPLEVAILAPNPVIS